MKKIEITELMDNYTDKEFFFEDIEDINTDNKAIKSKVMRRVKPITVKKPVKIIAAAAAAAVGLSAAAVATNFGVFSGTYKTASNIKVNIRNGDICAHYRGVGGEPCKYQDGRIIFTALGENKDITDLIDDKTPYIYSYKNEVGMQSYLIVGGNPGTVGYVDISNMGTEKEPVWQGVGVYFIEDELEVYGVDMAFIGLTEDQVRQLDKSDIAYAHIDENGIRTYSEEDREKRFVKTGLWNGFKLADWVKTAADYLNLYEAKERMCFDPDYPDEPLPSDEEFLRTKVFRGGSEFISNFVWPLSLEAIGTRHDISAAYESPIEERDGRLWVKVNGEEKDITELVDENTPYIEALDRPEDLEEYLSYEVYLIVGGTPGNYKYVELINNNNGTSSSDAINRSGFIALGDEVYGYTLTVDGEPIEWEQLIDCLEQGIDLTGRFDCETHWEPWYKAAYHKLAIGYNVLYAK